MTELLTGRALQHLRTFTRERTPFSLSVHYTAPHWPWEPPGDDSESRRIAGKSLFHYDGGTQGIYRQMVEHLDVRVGRLLDALAQSGAARDTLVIFISDNGGERFSNTWPFSGRRGELLEGGVRVPALLRWPRAIRAGATSEQVNVTMDWLPTLLAAAGVAPDPSSPSDGINLLPLLAPGAKPVPRKLFWRYKTNHQRSVRDGGFKLLKIQNNVFLFNVAEDPLEPANLRERHRDVYERLKTEWDQWNAAMLPESRRRQPRRRRAGTCPISMEHRRRPMPCPRRAEGHGAQRLDLRLQAVADRRPLCASAPTRNGDQLIIGYPAGTHRLLSRAINRGRS